MSLQHTSVTPPKDLFENLWGNMHRFSVTVLLLYICGVVLADDNLIQNGDFSDSTGAHWSFESNGARAQGSVFDGHYGLTVTTAGSSGESAPRLVQWGINLRANAGYLLTFKAHATDSGVIRVIVAGDGNLVFSDSARGLFSVRASEQVYHLPFLVSHSTGNARIQFNLGLLPAGIHVSLDSITLVKNTLPVIQLKQPVAQARWICGTERMIEWQNSDSLENVKIRCSVDSGRTWMVITERASNQNSFWWQIPETLSGTACMIIVSDLTGAVADTSGLFRIITAGTVDAREMVKNGSFIDTTDWHLSCNAPAKAFGRFENDRFAIAIDTIGSAPWHVKLEQSGFSLENGTMYRFSFDAWASHDRNIYANVGGENGDPAWSVYGGDTIPVPITTTRARYYQTIIMTYPTSGNIRTEFNCGNDTGKVYFGNVSLIKLENTSAFIINPSSGAILKSGATYTIEWHVKDVGAIELEFSSDSGATWSTLFAAIENLGAVAWTVPFVRSENCFIRIKNADDDSVLGESARFVINAFGRAVTTGELVTNGTFVNNLQGWNTSFHNAQGTVETPDGVFRVNISEPGESAAAIELWQSGIPVLEAQEYTLSFKAFANGTRGMGIRVLNEADSQVMVDTMIDLPSVAGKQVFRFTAKKDALARLAFLLGGSRADVFLDDVHFLASTPAAVKEVRKQQESPAVFSVKRVGTVIEFVNCTHPDGVVAVYSVAGVLLKKMAAGAPHLFWNGTTTNGKPLAAGCYIALYATPVGRQSLRVTFW